MMTVGAAGIVFGNLLGGLFGNSVGIVQLLILQGSGYVIGGLIVLYVTRRIRQRTITDLPNALVTEPGTHFVADP